MEECCVDRNSQCPECYPANKVKRDYNPQVSRDYKLKLYEGGLFCEMKSVSFKKKGVRKRRTRHYVHDTSKADISGDLKLRKQDELLEINGQTLLDKSYRHVRERFRSIRPDAEGITHLTLMFRRWEKREIDSEEVCVAYDDMTLYMTLDRDHVTSFCSPFSTFITRRHTVTAVTYKITEERLIKRWSNHLPAGNIDGVTIPQPACSDRRLKIFNTDKYIQHDDNGKIQARVLDHPDQGFLTCEWYFGQDTCPDPPRETISGFRLYYKDGNKKFYLQIYQDIKEELRLGFKEGISDDIRYNIDQRCFIIYKEAQYIFQSQIYRDKFIQYDKKRDAFYVCTIKQCMISCLACADKCPRDCRDAHRKFSKCRFQMFCRYK